MPFIIIFITSFFNVDKSPALKETSFNPKKVHSNPKRDDNGEISQMLYETCNNYFRLEYLILKHLGLSIELENNEGVLFHTINRKLWDIICSSAIFF